MGHRIKYSIKSKKSMVIFRVYVRVLSLDKAYIAFYSIWRERVHPIPVTCLISLTVQIVFQMARSKKIQFSTLCMPNSKSRVIKCFTFIFIKSSGPLYISSALCQIHLRKEHVIVYEVKYIFYTFF